MLSFLCPPVGLLMGYELLFSKGYKIHFCAFCFAIFMASFAYSYEPNGDVDLVRYFSYVDSLKTSSFDLSLIDKGIYYKYIK